MPFKNDPQHLCEKNWASHVHLYSQNWRSRDRRNPEACWPSSLVELGSFRFNDVSCLKNQDVDQLRKTPEIDLWPHMHLHIKLCTQRAQIQARVHMYTHREESKRKREESLPIQQDYYIKEKTIFFSPNLTQWELREG